jgi:hypothetical protein
VTGPWREPAEESVDLYPDLVVSDDRVSGSVTFGPSRLPIWAVIYTAIVQGWDDVEAGWDPSNYGWDAERLATFLYNLLEARGEFGRLLLVLADVERIEGEREDEMNDHAEVVVYTTPENRANFGGEGVVVRAFDDMPPPWWGQDDLRARVADQLRRCLAVLEEPDGEA